MKKLFIIILSLLPYIGFAFEYSQAKFPEAQFQSVSTYKSCTSYTPHITEVGAVEVYNTQQSTSHHGQPRKVNGNPPDPVPTPVGDTPWPLMILIIGFYIIKKKWKIMKSST